MPMPRWWTPLDLCRDLPARQPARTVQGRPAPEPTSWAARSRLVLRCLVLGHHVPSILTVAGGGLAFGSVSFEDRGQVLAASRSGNAEDDGGQASSRGDLAPRQVALGAGHDDLIQAAGRIWPHRESLGGSPASGCRFDVGHTSRFANTRSVLLLATAAVKRSVDAGLTSGVIPGRLLGSDTPLRGVAVPFGSRLVQRLFDEDVEVVRPDAFAVDDCAAFMRAEVAGLHALSDRRLVEADRLEHGWHRGLGDVEVVGEP